jgi:hypothetical protein
LPSPAASFGEAIAVAFVFPSGELETEKVWALTHTIKPK